MTPDTKPQPRPLIFISYSHLDKVWKDRLLSHLKVLEGQARLEAWADSSIEVGDDWEAKIQDGHGPGQHCGTANLPQFPYF